MSSAIFAGRLEMATILIIDDLAANREFLVTLLRYQGHLLIEATDGREGLAAVQTTRPDLVISDVLMPVMDGYEFVKQLRLDPKARETPVVFYTAHYGEREARAFALSSGVSYVLAKPAEPEEVLRIVALALSRETEAGDRPGILPATAEFDREHLRLLTDKLSEKTGDLRAANARLRAVINIGLELASVRDPARLLQNVVVAARDLFGATYVTLGIVNRQDRTVEQVITCGADATDWCKPGDAVAGLLGTVVTERRPLRGENPGRDPAALQLPGRHPEVQAFLAAPIASPAHVYGWMCLVGNEGRSFTSDDEHLLMALAGQLGRIYENGYYHAIAQKRAEELEREIVAHTRAEVALRHERDRAQRYMDTADVILLALDVDGRITAVNRKACDLLGWTERELLGCNWIEMCVPARIQNAVTQSFRDLVSGDLSIIENPVLTKSGEERMIEWRNRLLRDDSGRIAGTFGSGLDITDRKRAEQEASDRARLAALSAEVGLSLASDDSITEALRHCCEALVTHVGAAFARIWTLHEADSVLELKASAGLYTHLNGPHGKVPLGQFKIGRIARNRRPHLSNAVIGDPEVGDQEWARREGMVAFAGHPLMVGQRVVGVIALFARHALSELVVANLGAVAHHVALGIERHRSADALRTAEERMRFALEAASVGVWDMDYTTGVHRWSEIVEAHYGLQPGTFGGTFDAFVERIHPDDRMSVLETIEKATQSGADFSTEHRSIWPDGSVRWLSGTGRVLLGVHGDPVRAVGITQDVTDRHVLEAQYQQAQKMEAIGRLAAGVAHDFNNLLTVILGFSELLLDGLAPDDPRHADVKEIQKAGVRAAGLTRQLLAFSRKQIVEPTRLDLNVVMNDMRAMLGRLLREDVKVLLGLGSDLSFVMADRGQVEQIIMNLAVNAQDAMPSGGTLTLETANIELDERHGSAHLGVKPGQYVVLTVTDTGTGMTPQVQARLFEPFFTTKEVGKGTGLGLATVHGIVTRSGGSVDVQSEVGKGTSFRVYLPRAEMADVVAPAPPPVVRPHAGVETVLVVEDAEGLRELTRRLLRRHGYTVLVAQNADEALRLFEATPSIDLLLTDVVMPGASGPELTRQLLEQRPALKVIYMSGYTDEAILQHGALKPAVAFLHKPFTSDTLGRKIREVLDQ